MAALKLVGGGGPTNWTGGVAPVADTGTPSGEGPGAKDAKRRSRKTERRATERRAKKEESSAPAPDFSTLQPTETPRPGLYIDFCV
jgi:hypothetical protein